MPWNGAADALTSTGGFTAPHCVNPSAVPALEFSLGGALAGKEDEHAGGRIAECGDAIARVFMSEEFDMFLYEKMNFDRDLEVAGGSFRFVVDRVLKKAMQEGWDAALIAEVAKVRPLKPDVQAVYKKYAIGLVDESRRRQVDESLVEAMEKYGLNPEASLQRGGAVESTGTGTGSGLQKAIKKLIPDLDAGLWFEQFSRIQGRGGPRRGLGMAPARRHGNGIPASGRRPVRSTTTLASPRD